MVETLRQTTPKSGTKQPKILRWLKKQNLARFICGNSNSGLGRASQLLHIYLIRYIQEFYSANRLNEVDFVKLMKLMKISDFIVIQK